MDDGCVGLSQTTIKGKYGRVQRDISSISAYDFSRPPHSTAEKMFSSYALVVAAAARAMVRRVEECILGCVDGRYVSANLFSVEVVRL